MQAFKLSDTRTSVFATYSGLAMQYGAVNLGQGFPDYAPDPNLLACVEEALKSGVHQYAHPSGLAALRTALAELCSRTYGMDYDPETEITITAGATEAIFALLQALVLPGDEVLYLEPAYDSYRPSIRLAGGIPVPVSLQLPSGQLDFDLLEAAVSPRTKVLLLNTPHNPTGTVLGQEDLDRLAVFLERNSICLISDEVYAPLRFDQTPYAGVGTTSQLRSRSCWIGSFGKSLHVTGWKVGYVLAPPHLTQALRTVHQFVTFSVVTPLQHAIATYLTRYPDFQHALSGFFEPLRDLLCAELKGTGLVPTICRGTYSQCFSYPSEWGTSDDQAARRLVTEAGVVFLPISPFFSSAQDTGLLRACFAKKEETLREVGARLRRWALGTG